MGDGGGRAADAFAAVAVASSSSSRGGGDGGGIVVVVVVVVFVVVVDRPLARFFVVFRNENIPPLFFLGFASPHVLRSPPRSPSSPDDADSGAGAAAASPTRVVDIPVDGARWEK